MPHKAKLETLADARSTAVEQELQAFSYVVSHDLLTSFRHVAEFSKLLVKELGESLTERQQLQIGYIGAATDKCQSMMEQLLLFSRVQQKRLEPVRQDATAAMRLVMMRLSVANGAGPDISLAPLGEVFADADLLASTLHHLLDNAIKFHRPGAPSRIAIDPAHDEAFWRVRVADNGLGVEAIYREKAFAMFQRLNAEAAYPGIGAGLAICRRIARRHGGDVTFIDCAEGACVELALPHAPRFQ
jgi:two-component system CheB/CheR fusion protein